MNSGAPKVYYDPDFTVDISKRMQVPDRIKLAPSTNGSDMLQDPAIVSIKKMSDNAEWMRVPDRICVVGTFRLIFFIFIILTYFCLSFT